MDLYGHWEKGAVNRETKGVDDEEPSYNNVGGAHRDCPCCVVDYYGNTRPPTPSGEGEGKSLAP